MRIKSSRTNWLAGAAAGALLSAGLMAATPTLAVVSPNDTHPNTIIDTENTRPYLVGLGIRNYNGTSGGICSGLLINPRTVLFAAHCVDSYVPEAYNDGSGVAAVGYTTDPTFGINNLRDWLFGTSTGDGRTMDANSTAVMYHPGSRYYSSEGTFLPNDVAMAAFDTPTELLGRDGVNGIGLLFSPLTSPVKVTIGGYGQSGFGGTGARQNDFRRRLGSNMLDFLGSERDISLGIYGEDLGNALNPDYLEYQDLYWLDFDDPANPAFDNYFGTSLDANPLGSTIGVEGERITAAGDSGSPLITDAFGREVSLGVLSQGSRFFFDVPEYDDNYAWIPAFSNYGTTAGYNPLFMFWDYLVVNNPYKYVQAKAGDGEWTDPTHWAQEIDPLYYTLSGGVLVNQLPASTPETPDSTPNFGTINPNPAPPKECWFFSYCLTADDGEVTAGALERGEVANSVDGSLRVAANDAGYLSVNGAGGSGVAINQAQDTYDDGMDWAPYYAPLNSGPLTGPGSTGFVPTNQDGTSYISNSARYFEVNLRNNGTTYITDADIEIDRLNVRGANSGLVIRDGASLWTNISSFGDAGWVQVDGLFVPRAYTVYGGGLYGSGMIGAPGGISVIGGVLSPGARNGGIGTLEVVGDLAFGGAGVFGVDISGATSDKLNVDGTLTLGGGLAVAAHATPVYGQQYVVATSDVAIAGNFSAISSNFTGVLRPTYRVAGTNLIVEVDALPYSALIGANTPVANLLSDLRDTSYQSLKVIYDQLDPLPAEGLVPAFEALTPYSQFDAQRLGSLQLSMVQSFDFAGASNGGGGGVAVASTGRMASNTASVLAVNGMDAAVSRPVFVEVGEGVSGFFEVRHLNADADSYAGGQIDATATLLSGGFDFTPTPSTRLGVVLHHGKAKSDGAMSRSETKLTSLTVYGSVRKGGFFLNGYAGPGSQSYENERTVAMPGTPHLESEADARVNVSGGTLGYDHSFGSQGVVAFVGIDTAKIKIDASSEGTASPYAMNYDEQSFRSEKVRLGVGYYGSFGALGGTLTPRVSYAQVKENQGDAQALSLAFAAAPGQTTNVTVGGTDKEWDEVDLQVEYAGTLPFKVTFGYRTDLKRSDVESNTVYLRARKAF